MGSTTGQLLNAFERATRALKTLSAGNRTLLRADEENRLLCDMCAVIVEMGGYRVAGVAYADHSPAKRIDWQVYLGVRDGRSYHLDVQWLNDAAYTWQDGPLGRTAVGTAMRTRAPCIGRNILDSPLYAEPGYQTFRRHAIAGGYESISALPLVDDDNVIGALFMSAAEPDAFDDDELHLLGNLADDLAYGICTLRMREQHRQAQAMIERLAFFDPQTGLPNRTRLQQLLQEALARASGGALSLLQVEVGRLQEINQVFGGSAGGQLIEELGRRLAAAFPADQPVARVGEASFAVLLPGHDEGQALTVGQRLLRSLDAPVEVCDVMIDPGILLGIAANGGTCAGAEAMERHAHAALHQASASKRRIGIYDGREEQANASRLALMGDLRHAVERSELLLYCQPKVDIRTRQVSGAEALVRWAHPRRGLVPPALFIKPAEHSGMIALVTDWLLEAAFAQVRSWQQTGFSQSLAINLSAHDLYDPDFVTRVERLFAVSGVAPELIQFELTESVLIDEPAYALETLERLKRLGVELLIDDFGTGYSSLSYLQRFPVDAIKIDQSFIMPMMQSEDSAVIVRSTIELGHSLNMRVIAEGVEDEASWQSLAAHGCDLAQGYFVCKPMPAHEFPAWASAWRAK